MKYRVSYESFIVVDANNEDEAIMKAGENDNWQDSEVECVEDE